MTFSLNVDRDIRKKSKAWKKILGASGDCMQLVQLARFAKLWQVNTKKKNPTPHTLA